LYTLGTAISASSGSYPSPAQKLLRDPGRGFSLLLGMGGENINTEA